MQDLMFVSTIVNYKGVKGKDPLIRKLSTPVFKFFKIAQLSNGLRTHT